MMIKKGDKIELVKPMGIFTNIGEICDVIDVTEEGMICFKFGEIHMGCMSEDEFEKYFVKYEEPEAIKVNTVTAEHIEEIMNHSKVTVQTVFDKCTVVACQLPNGFVIVESSACVDPTNYDVDMGVEICMQRITDKVWELEGYRLQADLYDGNIDIDVEAEFEIEIDDEDECDCEECRADYCDSINGNCDVCEICIDNDGCCDCCY